MKSSNVVSIIDKTKTLKLDAPKKRERPANVEDIDKEDHKNPFLVSAYANDIYDYLKSLEVRLRFVIWIAACSLSYQVSRSQRSHPINEDYLKDREITPKVRAILIDWLVEIQNEHGLLQETLYVAVGILDTYLQVLNCSKLGPFDVTLEIYSLLSFQKTKPVSKRYLQLIGVTALFLAAKYEEITVPAVDDLVYISASSFKDSDLYDMEQTMFKAIDFDISRPISLHFLRRYSKAASVSFVSQSIT